MAMRKEIVSSICEKFGNEIANKVDYEFSHKFNHTLHAYIDITGNLIEGTLLSQILYWFSDDKNNRIRARIKRNGEYWIAKRRDEWWDEIRITDRQFDCAIKKLKEKGFVVLEKHKFNSMPTIYIRPDYDVINPALEEWKENMAKEILSKKIEKESIENGNHTLCNSHGNNTICNTGNTQDVTLLTMTTNRDYNTEIYKTKYAFPSEKCDTPSDKFSREYISKTINNIMVLQFGMDENSNKSKELTNIILYFFEQYEKRFNKKHPNIAFISYVNIIKEYMHLFGDNMAYIDDLETYQALIDKYFEENYNAQGNYGKEINLSLSHFMSGEIREHLCNRNGVLWERCDD